MIALAGFIILRNHSKFGERNRLMEKDKVYNLKKVKNVTETVSVTFRHMGNFIHEIRESLDTALNALYRFKQA